ncbi:MAG: pyridoxamine 5'-phosphate oxidase family protein [Leptolinea sp.]|nr:pyridoxamine 5'-phosphate oxidase family protein [Leptolinea sp.]
MFREMRRMKQELPKEEAIAVLESCSNGVLAVAGDDGYPYAVPMSYVYDDGRLIFHCAVEGHKLDAIRRDDRVSFCVVDREEVVPEKFSTIFRSVIVFGRAKIVDDESERRRMLEGINAKYAPGLESQGNMEIERNWNRVTLIEVRIEHMTGKIDLATMIERARAAREAAGEECPPKKA